MGLATIDELAGVLELSPSRVRAILGRPDAPGPVVASKHVGQGRTPGKFDQDEVVKYYRENHYKRKEKSW